MFDCGINRSEVRNQLRYRNPSPISILEPSIFAESCNSTETVDSYSTEGMSSVVLLYIATLYKSNFIFRKNHLLLKF